MKSERIVAVAVKVYSVMYVGARQESNFLRPV